jgi:hypothetical protein
MPQSELRLVKRSAEYIAKGRIGELPRQLRGIYVLYRRQGAGVSERYRVVYVGMAAAGRRGGIRGRLTPSSGLRPEATSSTIFCRNSGGYARRLQGIVDLPFNQHWKVSMKAGQLQTRARQADAITHI